MTSEATQSHRDAAHGRRARCAVLTVSDTRTMETDRGGALILEHLAAADHTVVARQIVRDEPHHIEQQLRGWLTEPLPSDEGKAAFVDVVITTGGTGIASRDTTVEIVQQLLSKELEGFGELFRMLSWDQVGAAAMLSRAVGGLAVTANNPSGAMVFALPGSTAAVDLAMTKLIVPELPHLIWERAR